MGFLQNLTGWHALILLAVVLLFFGAAKLPALARSLGQSARILKSEVAEPTETAAPSTARAGAAAPSTDPAVPSTESTVPATESAETAAPAPRP